MVPSSARATAPSASPLPDQLVPLLQEALDKIKAVISNVLPVSKKRTALEEAEWEDEEDDEGALEREILMQSQCFLYCSVFVSCAEEKLVGFLEMETLRVYRPRVVLHGDPGLGQSYIGSAALHHLEGFHIQTLDLGTLMVDSTRVS